ncbi:MAG: orotidine-5'-phosphate decarboxylase [Candidatus Thermoplasmatota archaeon]|nr:orotidine-5'-phosphate decarboxylase [Candidatus Thermoplasmatota archaeon]
MKRDSRMILALDETDPQKALKVAGEVGDLVDAVKINYPLVLSAGMEVVEKMSHSANVICDFKVADIPNTNRLIVEQVRARGAKGVICHGFVGHDSVKACVDAMGGGDVFVVTEMSHPGGMEFTQPNAEALARIAIDVGAAGVIAPATRPERIGSIRKIIGDKLILSPGVGAQGGKASDALRAGADYVIVGRAIYKAENPRKAAEALAEEIRMTL